MFEFLADCFSRMVGLLEAKTSQNSTSKIIQIFQTGSGSRSVTLVTGTHSSMVVVIICLGPHKRASQ